ncbi:coatomer subunit beta-1 [Tanacetum coccineum]
MLAVVSQIKVQELLRTTSIGRRNMIELFSVARYKGNSVPPIDKVMGSMQLIYMDIRMDVASYVEWMQFRTLDLLLCVNECVQPSINSKYKHSTSTYNLCVSHESECLVSEIVCEVSLLNNVIARGKVIRILAGQIIGFAAMADYPVSFVWRANFADTKRMAEKENRSPQQPPQPHTEYGFILMIQLILGRPLFFVRIGRMIEIATDSAKIAALKNAISLLQNGETLLQLFITIVRYVLPSEDHTVQKLLLHYLEIIEKTYSKGKVLPAMILICKN